MLRLGLWESCYSIPYRCNSRWYFEDYVRFLGGKNSNALEVRGEIGPIVDVSLRNDESVKVCI